MISKKNENNEIKSWIRDVNMNLVIGAYDVKIDISKRKDKRQWLKPNYKLIKYVTKTGGVLSGSRAIKCHIINGKQLLNRNTNDWDFIITRDMAFKICEHFGMVYDLSNFISIEKQRWSYNFSYSNIRTRINPVDVHLIIKDKLPDYTEIKGVRISNLSYTLNSKVEMIDDNSKHKNDLLQIITKFNSI
jgi:hypothetical protein